MQASIQILTAALEELLDKQSRWTEYELIQALKREPYAIFDQDALADTQALFETHFILFHCLYLIRQAWHEMQRADLDIHTLAISVRPYTKHGATVQTADTDVPQLQDPLASYYLDWSNFTETTQQDVEQLLHDFWSRMTGTTRQSQRMALDEAWQQLDLAPTADMQQVKRQYRKRVHQCHPDKGGSVREMQAIQVAYQRIIKS